MAVYTVMIICIIMVHLSGASGYSKEVRMVTERAVVGEPFTISIVLQDSAYFTEVVHFRNKSNPSGGNMYSLNANSRPSCSGGTSGFTATCGYNSNVFTYWMNITKTSISMYDRWIWNVHFTSDSSDIDTDIGTINPFALILTSEIVKESLSSSIQCRASSKKNTNNLTLYRLKQYWREEFIQERGVRGGNHMTVSLDWTSYQDSGRYECTASTGELDSDGNINQTVTRDIIAHAAPRADVSHLTVTARRGSEAVLSVTFLNTSDVTVRWSREGRVVTNQKPGLETQERQYQIYGKNVTSRGIVTRLHVRADDRTFGLYDVTSCSSGGCAATAITLAEKSPIESPRTPINFRVEANVTDGILLAWKSGQDGRQFDPQKETFYLTFRRSDDVAEDNWNYRLVEDSCPGLPVFYLLHNLLPNAGYDVRVQTTMVLEGETHRSSFTDVIYIYIDVDPSASDFVMIYLITILVILYVLLLNGCLGFFKIRIRRTDPKFCFSLKCSLYCCDAESTTISNDQQVLGVGIGIGVGIVTALAVTGLVVTFVIMTVRRRRKNSPHLNSRDKSGEARTDSAKTDHVTASAPSVGYRPPKKKEKRIRTSPPPRPTRGKEVTQTSGKMYDQLSGQQTEESYEGLKIYQN